MSNGNCSFPPCSCAAGLCLMESLGVGNTSTCAETSTVAHDHRFKMGKRTSIATYTHANWIAHP